MNFNKLKADAKYREKNLKRFAQAYIQLKKELKIVYYKFSV